jgi:hypothetical protein
MQRTPINYNLVFCLWLTTSIACVADTNTNWFTSVDPDDGSYTKCAVTEKRPFAEYRATKLSYDLGLESYDLPLDLSEVDNLERDIRNNREFTFTESAQSILQENGSVLLPAENPINRFDDAYTLLEEAQLPILVTVDSNLHLAHLFFEQVMKRIEVAELFPRLKRLLPALARSLAAIYKSQEGELQEAARRNLAFICVAIRLLGLDDFMIPSIVADQVEKAVETIETSGADLDHGRGVSPIFGQDCTRESACSISDGQQPDNRNDEACYCEDYTQYQPRGHYTETDALEKYFRCTAYLSRMKMRIRSEMETRMAALMTAALNKTRVDEDGEETNASFIWDTIYRTVSFFTGASDDLTFIEYDRLLRQHFGEDFNISDLSNNDTLEAFRNDLQQQRLNQASTGFEIASLQNTQASEGLGFLSKHFVFDTYVLNQLVDEAVGPRPEHESYQDVLDNLDADCLAEAGPERVTGDFRQCAGQSQADWHYLCCSAVKLSKIEQRPEIAEVCRRLPSGLDIAATFGSETARDYLLQTNRDYCGYEQSLDTLRQEATSFSDDDWYKTLYSTWELALQPLFSKDFTGFPSFMTTDIYTTKNLGSALSSWAELRHDTIHYIEQSYEPIIVTVLPPKDLYWVEPIPEVYAAISDLAKLIRTGLTDIEMVDRELSELLQAFVDLQDELVSISINELAGEALTGGEKFFIEDMGRTMHGIIDDLALITGVKTDKPSDDPNLQKKMDIQGDPYRTSIIAEVYTDDALNQSLQAGSGHIAWMIAVRRIDEQTLGAMIGPVFRYGEFSWPAGDRLDDDRWTEMLNNDEAPSGPDFFNRLYPVQP